MFTKLSGIIPSEARRLPETGLFENRRKKSRKNRSGRRTAGQVWTAAAETHFKHARPVIELLRLCKNRPARSAAGQVWSAAAGACFEERRPDMTCKERQAPPIFYPLQFRISAV